jgi:hypothetical protein
MHRRLTAALLAACLLAAPAAALAQSAGDEQYADPFGNVDEPSQNNGGSNGSGAPGTDTTASAPATAVQDQAAPAAAAGSGSSSSSLPLTGFPAALSAMLGALLLVMGASVWRRAQPPLALPPWLTPAASRRTRFGGRRRRRR